MRNGSASGGVKWAARSSVFFFFFFWGSCGQTRLIRCAFAKKQAQMSLKPRVTEETHGVSAKIIFGKKKKINKNTYILALLTVSQLLLFPNAVGVFTQTPAWHLAWVVDWSSSFHQYSLSFCQPASCVCHNCIAQATLLVRVLVPSKSPEAESSCKCHSRDMPGALSSLKRAHKNTNNIDFSLNRCDTKKNRAAGETLYLPSSWITVSKFKSDEVMVCLHPAPPSPLPPPPAPPQVLGGAEMKNAHAYGASHRFCATVSPNAHWGA